MMYRGHVENGLIRLDTAETLPDGVPVEVRILADSSSPQDQGGMPSVVEVLKDFVGKADGLPPDASHNLDHYLYGRSKQR
jgi:hypothetical protein